MVGPSELPELAIGVFGAAVYAVYQTRAVAPKKAKKVRVANVANNAQTPANPRYGGEFDRHRSNGKPRSPP